MAITLLADENIEGHFLRWVAAMRSDYWRVYWDHLALCGVSFPDVGLARGAPDFVVWHTCQRERIYLLTDNRNGDRPGSLEATIRLYNTPDSLPIFTLSDANQILQSRPYIERVVASLYDKLLSIDTLRGTGRLFLP